MHQPCKLQSLRFWFLETRWVQGRKPKSRVSWNYSTRSNWGPFISILNFELDLQSSQGDSSIRFTNFILFSGEILLYVKSKIQLSPFLSSSHSSCPFSCLLYFLFNFVLEPTSLCVPYSSVVHVVYFFYDSPQNINYTSFKFLTWLFKPSCHIWILFWCLFYLNCFFFSFYYAS